MYACPNCSANLKFNIEKQALYCDFCNNVVDPYAISKERDAEEDNDEYYQVTTFRCPQCSGEIISEDNEAAAFCSFCGASTILDSRISNARRPQFIVPFKKTKQDCMNSYNSFMRGAFFAPTEMKSEKCVESFRGIYMPFWTYSTSKHENVTVNGNRTYYRGDYKYTENHALSADVDMSYDNVAYDASSNFADNLSQGISPFDQTQQKQFTPSFLSGFYADTSDVDAMVYQNDAQTLIAKNAYDRFKKTPGFGRYGMNDKGNIEKMKPNVDRKFLTMLPVWFMSIRSKDKKGEERVSYTVVNGQTGKIVGDVPISFNKYLIASVILSLGLFVLLNFLFDFSVRPLTSLILSAIVSIIMAIIFSMHEDEIVKHELGEDDKGLVEVNRRNASTENNNNIALKQKQKKQMMDKMKEKSYAWIPICIAGLIFVLDYFKIIVSNYWYYGGSIIIMAYTVWCIIRIVRRYNKLTTRKLPQFNRTGGDDSAQI